MENVETQKTSDHILDIINQTHIFQTVKNCKNEGKVS